MLLRDSASQLFDWLSDYALPLWSSKGVDWVGGGFVERIEPDGTLVSDVRRARLVARQIYAFHTARELGWKGRAAELIQHGTTALLTHHVTPDNAVVPRFVPSEGRYEGDFDLYDQAFVLFGLSIAARNGARELLEERAAAIVRHMRNGWQHPLGGFGESVPPTAPLKANPHMHLLEASLSWMGVSGAPLWRSMASEVAELCLARFLSPQTGALHELFDADWALDLRSPNDVVEPGHQAEWAWLLQRWSDMSGSEKFGPVAHQLFRVAEEYGYSAAHAKLINELHATLEPRWSHMRLWPQTEWIKALVLFAEGASSQTARETLEDKLASATSGLLDYFNHPIQGSWWEHIDERAQPVMEPARASSLYHIMGAAAELARYTQLSLR